MFQSRSRKIARLLVLSLSFSCLSFDLARASNATEVLTTSSPTIARAVLSPLIGNWQVSKNGHNYFFATRKLVDGAIHETTNGSMQGQNYFRMGVLSFNKKMNQYEWTSIDSFNPAVAEFTGRNNSDVHGDINLYNVVDGVRTRTRIHIFSRNKHVFETYFKNEKGHDVLIDRMTFARVK